MAMIQQPDGSEEFRFAGMNMALVAVMIDRVVVNLLDGHGHEVEVASVVFSLPLLLKLSLPSSERPIGTAQSSRVDNCIQSLRSIKITIFPTR